VLEIVKFGLEFDVGSDNAAWATTKTSETMTRPAPPIRPRTFVFPNTFAFPAPFLVRDRSLNVISAGRSAEPQLEKLRLGFATEPNQWTSGASTVRPLISLISWYWR
jgi:hypothetical protein